MHPPPDCHDLGPQCHRLAVTLRIGTLDDGPGSLDHEATWLLGHTAKIHFRNLRLRKKDLLVDAELALRCRFLKPDGDGVRCAAHGFTGPAPARFEPGLQPRRLEGDRFLIVHRQQVSLETLPAPRSALPVLEGTNPCATAICRTAEHTRGAACCRDLQIEVLCGRQDTELEALVRSRLSPYLCKVTREAEDALEAEMISACGYLDDDGRGCTLHGRTRADGRPAKPDLCSEWPPKGKGIHPGCVFGPSSVANGDTKKAAKRQQSVQPGQAKAS